MKSMPSSALKEHSANPFAMQELAGALRGVDIPVLVKNPVNPDLELWIGAIERLYNAGLRRLGAIHRGFSSYDRTISPSHADSTVSEARSPQIPVTSPASASASSAFFARPMVKRKQPSDTSCTLGVRCASAGSSS